MMCDIKIVITFVISKMIQRISLLKTKGSKSKQKKSKTQHGIIRFSYHCYPRKYHSAGENRNRIGAFRPGDQTSLT